jgi:hypothetical protein
MQLRLLFISPEEIRERIEARWPVNVVKVFPRDLPPSKVCFIMSMSFLQQMPSVILYQNANFGKDRNSLILSEELKVDNCVRELGRIGNQY